MNILINWASITNYLWISVPFLFSLKFSRKRINTAPAAQRLTNLVSRSRAGNKVLMRSRRHYAAWGVSLCSSTLWFSRPSLYYSRLTCAHGHLILLISGLLLRRRAHMSFLPCVPLHSVCSANVRRTNALVCDCSVRVCSVLGLRAPGLELRIQCLGHSVISPSSGGSPGPV